MDTTNLEIRINQLLDDQLAIIAHDFPKKHQPTYDDHLNRVMVGMVESFRQSILEVVKEIKTIEK